MFGYRIIKERDYEALKEKERRFNSLSDDYNFLSMKLEQEKKDNEYFRKLLEKLQKPKSVFNTRNKHQKQQ